MWPSSKVSKILSLLLLLILIFCIFMDVFLFIRIREYKIDIFESRNESTIFVTQNPIIYSSLPNYDEVTWIPCSVNPLCHPTVKGLLIDHINHYIYAPLCGVMDMGFKISESLFITPNMISFFHVLVAFVAAKLVTTPYLSMRRLGVVLFQLRMFLDDLDGYVARERNNVKGERSEVGTLGYFVDGFCDMLGVIAFMAGVTIYLRNNLPRRGYKDMTISTLPYHQLKEINSSDDIEKDVNEGISFKTKVTFARVVQVISLFSGQIMLSSLAWNRYIDVYQDLLENCNELDVVKRDNTFRSGLFFFATSLWRVLNPHCYLHLLSFAVFCDNIWSFLKAIHFSGYMVLVLAVAISEYFVERFKSVVLGEG